MFNVVVEEGNLSHFINEPKLVYFIYEINNQEGIVYDSNKDFILDFLN